MPTITVVLPTYKRPQLLARAIESVRSQSWKELCVVVRDNCSCDETEAVVSEIAKLDPRIVYIKNKSNIGAHENFRQGIQNIETDYFSILSDDDFLEPTFFSEAMSLFEQYPQAGFIAFRVDIVNLSGDVICDNSPRYKETDEVVSRFYDSEDGFDGYMNNLFPCTWTGYIFRKEVSLALDLEDFAEVGYEHVNYFRLSDFSRIFGRIVHADRAFGGQYLRVIADLSTLRLPHRDPDDAVRFPEDITARLKAQTETGGDDDIVWGGASKGVIFSLLRERAGHPVGRVIDINPAKQERYLAATGLRVMSPAEGLRDSAPNARILVMNPNYLDEIRYMTDDAFTYVGVSA